MATFISRTLTPVGFRYAVLVAAVLLAKPTLAQDSRSPISFDQQIRPILSKSCFHCHGPDTASRQANLRLDTRPGAIGQDGGHTGIIPGDSASSRVIIRLTHSTRPMPPTGERLPDEQIDLIRRWIDEGAEYTQHWAFRQPVRYPLPAVDNSEWPRSAIDHFVLARLEKEGFSPSKEADRYTLIRRLYLDLIGLPPTPEQTKSFIADDSPNAYEKVVDGLFNSPHYGERWARVWLDLARYADSKGYERDALRSIWPYRDWVIRALNANMPFDRFTVLQLAGDLLPVPTKDQLVATGFHRNTMANDEGGTDDEEFRDLAVKDRVATTGQVWMGLTWGCAQCHSHKYDPLSHKEFYQLYAFFNQTADSDKADERPTLPIDGKTATLVMRELPADKGRETHIHRRGSFLDKGDLVGPVVPGAFHPLPNDAPLNRLGLAKWLVDKNNPLTARVSVNRSWARIFGTGLVETEEDFGTQGEAPSHPELLDWLATEFMRLDWDVKAIQKLIVMSATYRQSSAVDPDLLKRDPNNRLLARGPMVRLEAEMIRDQMLAVSGLLRTKMHGPPVMPLQPDDVWQTVYSGENWDTSPDEDRYRRGLYTLWRRTSPYPSALNFDAPTGEVCVLRRFRTNTPLQALVTLNDPLALEAAQHLADRVLTESEATFEDRVQWLFLLGLSRSPSDDEIGQFRQLLQKAGDQLRTEKESTQTLLNVDRIIYRNDRRETLILISDEGASPWKYTLQAPMPAWREPNFDDSGWAEGLAMFGNVPPEEKGNERLFRINTPWDTEHIWMRRVFEIESNDLADLRAMINFRDTFELYLNGVLAAESLQDFSGKKEYRLYPAAQRALRLGRNVVSVAARRYADNKKAQFVDVGLSAVRPPQVRPSQPDDLERAAWVVMSHVMLNLDEFLTKN